MWFSRRFLWFGLRACVYCGSLDRRSDGLCDVCSEELWSWVDPDTGLFVQRIEKLQVESLFHWVPGRHEVLSRLVGALKGANAEDIWNHYANEFWRLRLLTDTGKVKPLLLIPSPSRGGHKDHALAFAEGLAAMSGAQIYSCLSRLDEKSQRKKSRSERLRLRMEYSANFTLEDFAQKSAGRYIVFVDDIVTTGATARAAWKCLGKPRDFAVWSLAQRGLSCGASRDLV